jgi:hypothetical protein
LRDFPVQISEYPYQLNRLHDMLANFGGSTILPPSLLLTALTASELSQLLRSFILEPETFQYLSSSNHAMNNPQSSELDEFSNSSYNQDLLGYCRVVQESSGLSFFNLTIHFCKSAHYCLSSLFELLWFNRRISICRICSVFSFATHGTLQYQLSVFTLTTLVDR